MVKVERGILPSFRRMEGPPNLVIACDMVGPYHMRKLGVETRGSGTQKVWLLFAVNTYSHQVFVTGLDSQSLEDLMQGFSELFVHTGKPTIITSDAGSNFNTLARKYTAKQLVPPKKKDAKVRKPKIVNTEAEETEEVQDEPLDEGTVYKLQKLLEKSMGIEF